MDNGRTWHARTRSLIHQLGIGSFPERCFRKCLAGGWETHSARFIAGLDCERVINLHALLDMTRLLPPTLVSPSRNSPLSCVHVPPGTFARLSVSPPFPRSLFLIPLWLSVPLSPSSPLPLGSSPHEGLPAGERQEQDKS